MASEHDRFMDMALEEAPKGEAEGVHEFENVIHQYSEVLEGIEQEPSEKYPAGVYPQSLLPYPKELIREALKSSLRSTEDEQLKETLKKGLVFLDDFVEDTEANKENSEMLEALLLAADLSKRNQQG